MYIFLKIKKIFISLFGNKAIDVSEIFSEISDRICNKKTEGIEYLFELIPENSDKKILSQKYFWKARYYLGINNTTKAIEYFELLDESWNSSMYYSASLWLGRIYSATHIEKAMKYWEVVPKEQEYTFYHAQKELEDMYYRQKNYIASVECLLTILSVIDNIEQDKKYSLYWQIAHSYRLNDQLLEAKEYLSLIPIDKKMEYGQALLELYRIEETSETIAGLSLIEEDWGYVYSISQYFLGDIAYESSDVELAINRWLAVTDNLPWCYVESQQNLFQKGIKYALENSKYDLLNTLLLNIHLPVFEYEINLLKDALVLSEYFENDLFHIYLIVEKIKKALQVNQDGMLNQYSLHVAHYTTCYVSKIILGANGGKPGSLQMSVADLMNDPTEGKVLHYILGQPDWLTHRFNHRYYQAYASCFSFNHDSLNQFRLYGKDSGKEATGVSMVFRVDMFAHNTFSANISITTNIKKSLHINNIDHSEDFQEVSQDAIKYPLYHCIYYDPKSGYYKLASRAEMTFYRQGKIDGKLPQTIKDDWLEYSKIINTKELVLKELFNDLKDEISNIENILKLKDPIKGEQKEKIINLINGVLLPIQFLVKHAAYIEEDECRMLYITNAGSDVIKEQNGRLYIEYEPSVVEHLDKIYLSDGAKEERAFLERAWQKALDRDGVTDKSIDIRDSDNPFRI